MIKDIPHIAAPKKIRIKFSKTENLIYISHLDLVRTMTRAIIRARIPVKYTEGYNPIPKLVFAAPLSVGASSECEYLDIKIDRDMSCVDIYKSLSKQFDSGIEILDVYEPKNKFTDAEYSSYSIVISDPDISEESYSSLREVFLSDKLVVRKRTKSGEKEVDILPYIKSFEISYKDHAILIDALLCVSSANYLNPEYITNVVYESLNISKHNYADTAFCTIHRKQLYLSDGVTLFK
ncbi:MAG: DUF2344 domain-containing protein [Clostridia bacterium]|nr:DUF2344 domain-containing protein [Clostridia bacterium]